MNPIQPPARTRRLHRWLPLLLLLAAADLPAQVGGIPDGFTPIFNGVDLTGWHPSLTSHQGITPAVTVEDGTLVLRQNPFGQGGVLLTDRRFRDFELYLEARLDPGTNGGIFLRSTESGSAYQIELEGGSDATGALLGEMLRVTTGARAERLREVWREGEWNRFRIRMVGDAPRIGLWINDVPMWEVAAERNDLIAGATAGMIGLQVHWSTTFTPVAGSFDMHGSWRPGAAHRFRNIAVREIGGAHEGGHGAVPAAHPLAGSGGAAPSPPAGAPRHGPAERVRKDGGGVWTGPVGMEFVRIPAGSMVAGRFQPTCPAPPAAGAADDPLPHWTAEHYRLCRELAGQDARPGFTVTIDRPFWIGRFEVTQGEWRRVMGANPSVFQNERVGGDADRHPVDNVTWEDAQAFLARLNQLDPGAVYRLPTEWEWEYAARAGRQEELPWPQVRDHAWIALVDRGTTQPVGGKRPNAWGVHDMLGNVWEWVQDPFNGRTLPDPAPPRDGAVRVLRGGSFLSDVKNATFAGRGAGPGNGFDVGFRVVREIP